MPDQTTIYLHSNAAIYLALKKIGRFIPFIVVLSIVHFINTSNPAGVRVNGHPATPANLQFLHMLSHAAAFLIFAFIIGVIVYCVFLARSYSIELRKEGIALKYGILNLNSEVLLFTKIQDILINRSLIERMLGISSMVVQNAMGKPESIPGLGADDAEKLRETILSQIHH